MKPVGLVLGAAALVAAAVVPGQATGAFDQKLSKDRQVVHALNRLAFGPRPGDVEHVRRTGLDKWIRQQLYPERIPEPATLQAKLEPLTSLTLTQWQVFEQFRPRPPVVVNRPSPAQLLPPAQLTRLMKGSTDDRRAVLASVDPGVRQQLLASLPLAVLADLPDLKEEVAIALKAQATAVAMEFRRLNPPLPELLGAEAARTIASGPMEARAALLRTLDPETRRQALRMIPPQNVPEAFRREAMGARDPQGRLLAELVDSRLYRAVYSPRQLQEVLTDFWFNHFNVFSGKGNTRMFLTAYERDAIRPHVLGRFRDLLHATARHPAMLFYLDNWQSQMRDTPAGPAAPVFVNAPATVTVTRGPQPGLNENYGRELLELHTLGVDGGYTQDDVVAVARAFTGWTIHEPNRWGEFFFNPAMHDRKPKTVLGHDIPAPGGEGDGLIVLDLLSRHPSTARFISRKLAQRFVADDPPAALVTRMADRFVQTDGDLRAVLETMFASREFMSEGAWRAKVKSPFEMVVSALRALGADVGDGSALAQRLTAMGQPLYGRQDPSGYPNTGESWSSAAALLARMNFAVALASGEISGVTVDLSSVHASDASAAATILMGWDRLEEERRPFAGALNGGTPTVATLAGVVIGSPEFQKR